MTTLTQQTIDSKTTQEIAALAPWFHNLHLPDGSQTFPNHWLGDFPRFKWLQIADSLPADLRGWSCLDIGCNAGFYSFEIAKRGASVLGIDLDERYLRQARWAARQFGVDKQVRFERMQVYDLAKSRQQFDLVLFMGVLYHLRYPMLGLDVVCQRVKRQLVFQTLMMPGNDVFDATWGRTFKPDDSDRQLMLEAGWPKMAFLEHGFADDPTNWWCPNHAGVLAMLRSAGMRILHQPGHEIYICEPNPKRPACVTTWNAAELLAATGQPWQNKEPDR